MVSKVGFKNEVVNCAQWADLPLGEEHSAKARTGCLSQASLDPALFFAQSELAV